MKDDDCNGQIDENAPPVMMWPDADGDGYYPFQTGTPKIGCGSVAGYAARGGDCNDHDATIHPGATEVCNLKDDNCDGEVDERVRPTCGLGWCSRYSPTCNAADCVPGPPATETCNSFDDDCDGELDNGACPAGMICSGSQCVSNGGVGPARPAAPPARTRVAAARRPGRRRRTARAAAAVNRRRAGAPSRRPAAQPTERRRAPRAALGVLLGLLVLRRTNAALAAPRRELQVPCVKAAMRFFISSGDTSSTCEPSVQMWPNGSCSVPVRSP